MATKKQKLQDDEEQVVMSISLSREMKKGLKLYAVEHDVSVSQLLRGLIRERLEHYGTQTPGQTNDK
jgi:hypothetical protein